MRISATDRSRPHLSGHIDGTHRSFSSYFRDRSVAAPLKRAHHAQLGGLCPSFPRPIGRGPIEASLFLPRVSVDLVYFRDRSVAAPLKRAGTGEVLHGVRYISATDRSRPHWSFDSLTPHEQMVVVSATDQSRPHCSRSSMFVNARPLR